MLTVHIIPTTTPPGKLADVELHFTPLREEHPASLAITYPPTQPAAHDIQDALRLAQLFAGLKLIGFAVWQRRDGTSRNVTFPARQYSVNGERRSFALLRPIGAALGATLTDAQDRVREFILAAYAEWEAAHHAPDVVVDVPMPAPVTATIPAAAIHTHPTRSLRASDYVSPVRKPRRRRSA